MCCVASSAAGGVEGTGLLPSCPPAVLRRLEKIKFEDHVPRRMMNMNASQKKKRRKAFGPTPRPVIDCLKDILCRYPDGGQILKELIQNADDAGATAVAFIHDERAYETQTLWTEDLHKYQGPALYAYNNAEFTEDDWGGIQGRSNKRNDPNKVGRFGIGFNSVYHITDNRRHIKWKEEDQKFDMAACWNELLVKEVLPHAYHMIILDTIDFSQHSGCPSSTVYRLWPDIDQMKHRERWYDVAMEMLQHFLQLNKAVLAGATDEWVTLSEAVFLSDDNMEPEMKTAVSGVLIAQGEKLVSIPSHVSRDIQVTVQSPNTLKMATPAFVRNVLRKSATVNLSREDKLFLLEYVLSDEQYHELWGLQLLPLSNGTFKAFTNEDDNLALIDNEQFPW
ncbi:hypothetical protein AAFF_G00073160 [Aldrovandia affinis]|uniref:Sacsin/Nov domain-containing protein n=1 Tax=Aldrovandia affinis TaxID=143900 RepID=A0AAD7RYC5_9TELE|nr:hypothetical protein AAFF_G00073160 [Aldrovandia affinis]